MLTKHLGVDEALGCGRRALDVDEGPWMLTEVLRC
jgi:hypothetical protein